MTKQPSVPPEERKTIVPAAPERCPRFRKSSQQVAIPSVAFKPSTPEALTMPPRPYSTEATSHWKAECTETGLVAYGDTAEEARINLDLRRARAKQRTISFQAV